MNYLGLDYGEKQVGVAIAVGPLAEPLITVTPDQVFNTVKSLIHKQNIGGLVIGITENGLHPTAREIVSRLSLLNLPVYFVDETLTSHDARRFLFHTTRKKRKALEHAVSAALILQSWLDSHSENLKNTS